MAKFGKNRLKEEVSPYLLQHADNPVHWWSWGPEALAAAKADGKPILLSIGYAACHWCHVMAHESFEDDETARLMNDLFINIKVDREERPDLDAIYQRALGMLGTQGGWPLTMFLDAGGAPFWGGTYFPSQPRHGLVDFKTVLRQVSGIYHANPAAVEKNRAALLRGLREIGKTGAPEVMTEEVFLGAAKLMLSQMDPEYGGTLGAPKFPNVLLLELLWRAGIRTGEAAYRDAVTLTLTRICQGGIYDHLGGGVARYSTDPYWLAPHFEKMLYDNALLISLLTEVWKETRNPLFEARVRETIAWLFEEMMTPGGAFASAIDADSEGEEGAFYVWSKEEIERVLGSDAARFNQHYSVQEDGNWEGKTILNRLHDPDHFDAKEDAALKPLRDKLLAAREGRPRPLRDDKVLADWNGLMISALAAAGQTFGQPAWVDAARKAFDFIADKMCKGGLLYHSFRKRRLGAAAFLDDYATIISASVELFSLSGDENYLSKAKIWTSEAEKWLSEPDFNGFYTTSSQNTDLIARPRSNFDQVTPAGNSLMIRNYTALYRLSNIEDYRTKADKLLKVFAGEARTAPMSCPGFFSAFVEVVHGAHLVIKDQATSPRTKAFLEQVAAVSFPGLVVHIAPGAEGLKTGDALLCRGAVCSLPLTRPAMLKEELIRLRQNRT